jgi:arginine utilization protein RocB
MKTTPWNEWNHIKTLDEAKDYVEAIYEEWDKEAEAAAEDIIEILESYMEFINIMQKTLEEVKLPPKIKTFSDLLIEMRKTEWEPVLLQLKENQKARKAAKKSA